MSTEKRVIPLMNEVLMKKYKKLFDHYDVNKNGVWDEGDWLMIFEQVHKNTSHLDECKRKQVKDMITSIIKDVATQKKVTVTWEEYISLVEHYLENPKELEKVIIDFRSSVFDCIDGNGDGTISFDEYKIFQSYEKMYDEKELKRIFNILDRNKDGFIDRDEYVSAYITYFMDRTMDWDYLPLFD